MEKKFVKVLQQGFIIYAVSLSVDELIHNTKVEYYDSRTGKGYQRPLVPSHYRKIAKYLQTSSNPILPTAILTAVDPSQIEEGNIITIKDKLRIVDGQHRIEGIKYLEKIDNKAFERIRKYSFSTLIMVIAPEQQIHEINAFININKTSKPVSTDLAVQLRDRIRGDNIELILDNLNESIATKIGQNLNAKKESIWFESIKFGDEKTKGRTISINAFYQSLFGIIDNYLKSRKEPIQTLENYYEVIDELTYFIGRAWEIIQENWIGCFNKTEQQKRESYNIQKGIGVYSLHEVIGDVMEECKGDTVITLKRFKEIIVNSQVEVNDWAIGGPFSSYNSKAGFHVIAKYIANKKSKLE